MDQKKRIILIAGPSASGKSLLAIKLAQKIKGHIINADSMQIYKEFKILTSRPSSVYLKTTKHHLYGFQSVKNNFSTGQWLQLAILKINECLNNQKIPIVVGGTGLYFKSLTDGLVKIPNIPKDLRNQARKLQQKIGQDNFFRKLIEIDPLVKKFISPKDTQRSIRAYEVKKFTKKSLFLFKKQTKPNFNTTIFNKIFINMPKEQLHRKIDIRTEKMFKEGAVNEVKNFLKLKINNELTANKILGIREIKSYLEGSMTLAQTKEVIKLKTRQYAKRQLTWFRGHMRSWEMIYSSNTNNLFKKTINKIL